MNKFNYDEEMASQIGGGQYVTKSGGYDFKVMRSEFRQSDNNKAEFLDLDFTTREGLKLDYVSINFTKSNGESNDFGHKMIQAIMGCMGVNALTNNNGKCNELYNKGLKGVVQRVEYTKTTGQNAGQDGYRFEFKLPANIQTGKTVKESISNSPALAFDQYASTIEDKDTRNVAQHQSAPQQQSGGFQQQTPQQQQPAPMDFDDDDGIPF